MASFTYATQWFARAVVEHDSVAGVEELPTGHVRIDRRKHAFGADALPDELPSITVAPIHTPRVDLTAVKDIFAVSVPTIIALIPKKSHYDWSARDFAERGGSTIHTFKEFYTFLGERDPRPFIDKNLGYVMERLDQHSAVASLEMICEASMRLKRKGSLSDVLVAVEYEYEFSEEALVQAIKRHPDATVIINANPNGRATSAAMAHAENAEVTIFGVSELMGALNYDGKQFRSYKPRHRHG
jgi:hypothetical protein